MMVIKIKNPAPQKFNKKEDGTLLSTKENHKGLGLSSVRNTVEKYHGDMQIKYTDQMFSVIISIMNEKSYLKHVFPYFRHSKNHAFFFVL